ncbi:MAG TPA: HAMP domain-containing protein [Methanosarcinales archaeon]|nr:HAMP domain-containing protein [Methanosarcinales archaeon]
MRIGTKLAGGFAIMLILMALLGVSAYTAMNTMKLQFDIVDRAATMEADMLQARRYEKDYIMRGDPEYLNSSLKHLTGVESAANEIAGMVKGEEEISLLNEVLAAVPRYITALSELRKNVDDREYALQRCEAGARDVESAIETSSASETEKTSMLLAVNRIRRFEKNFVIQNDLISGASVEGVEGGEEYTTAISAGVNDLKAEIDSLSISSSEKDVIKSGLDTYLAGFMQYRNLAVAGNAVISVDSDLVQAGRVVGTAAETLLINAEAKAASSAKTAMTAIIASLFIAIATGMGIAILLTRSITGPLKEVMIGANRIRDGDFSYDVKVDSDDELGDLACTFGVMKSDLQAIVSEAIRIAKEAQKGNLDVRVDVPAKGEFKELVDNVNAMIEAIIVPIRENIRVMNAYAGGELGTRVAIETDGEFRELAETLDQFGEEMQAIISEEIRIVKEAQRGNLDVRADVPAKGEFRELVDGMNAMIDVITVPILENIRILDSYGIKRSEGESGEGSDE